MGPTPEHTTDAQTARDLMFEYAHWGYVGDEAGQRIVSAIRNAALEDASLTAYVGNPQTYARRAPRQLRFHLASWVTVGWAFLAVALTLGATMSIFTPVLGMRLQWWHALAIGVLGFVGLVLTLVVTRHLDSRLPANVVAALREQEGHA